MYLEYEKVREMKLSELLKELDYQFIQGELDNEVTQIDYDSRCVKEGSLFVCIPGAKVDGHSFIKQVIQNGAKTIVVEHPVEYQQEIGRASCRERV